MFEHETAREYRKVLRLSSRFTLKINPCKAGAGQRSALLSCLQSLIYLDKRIGGKVLGGKGVGTQISRNAVPVFPVGSKKELPGKHPIVIGVQRATP